MKINITTSPAQAINGYKNYFIEDQGCLEEIQNIVNNCCSEIIFTGIDYIDHDKVDAVLALLLSKLRLGGRILISGINFDSVIRAALSEQLSETDFSKMIENIKSIRSRSTVASFLRQRNLLIDSSISKGSLYEVSAIRQ